MHAQSCSAYQTRFSKLLGLPLDLDRPSFCTSGGVAMGSRLMLPLLSFPLSCIMSASALQAVIGLSCHMKPSWDSSAPGAGAIFL